MTMAGFYKIVAFALLASAAGVCTAITLWLATYFPAIGDWVSTWPQPYVDNVRPTVLNLVCVLNSFMHLPTVAAGLVAFLASIWGAVCIRAFFFVYHQFWGGT